MNERIQELADKTWRITSKSASDEFCEKFAELIVRECIGIVANLPNGYKDYRDQIENAFREDCIEATKQHFGV